MSCTTTIASNGDVLLQLQEVLRALEVAANDEYWRITEIYRKPPPLLQQGGADYNLVWMEMSPIFGYWNDSFPLRKSLYSSLEKLREIAPKFDLPNSGGGIRIKTTTLGRAKQGIQLAIDFVDAVLLENWLGFYVGGKLKEYYLTLSPFTTYYMTAADGRSMVIAGNQIGKAADEVAAVYRALSVADCEEDEGADCAAIIKALEDLAAAIREKNEAENSEAGFPLTVPKTLIKGKEEGEETLETTAQTLRWIVLQLDALFGEFPIEICIEDTNPTTEAKEEKFIKIPNLAEGIAELLGMSIELQKHHLVTMDASLRTLIELGTVKTAQAKEFYAIEGIVDYLGYPTEEKEIEVPMALNPQGEKFYDLLKNTNCPIVIEKRVPEGKKKSVNLQKVLSEFLTAAAILRALCMSGDSAEDIKKAITNPDGGDDEDEWKVFKRDVEQDHINAENRTAPDPANLKPYGRDFDRRPRIKELEMPAEAREDI